MQKYHYKDTELHPKGIEGFIYPLLQVVGMLLMQINLKNVCWAISIKSILVNVAVGRVTQSHCWVVLLHWFSLVAALLISE